MKIAYFVDRFPLISETFVVAQIVGMIDRGHDVTIFANRRINSKVQHAAVAQYGLLEKTVFVPEVVPTLAGRILPAIKALMIAIGAGHASAALRALNVVRFGKDALGLRLLLRAAPHFGSRRFDIIHCQFGQLGVGIPALRQCGALQGTLVTSFRGTDAMKNASQNPARFSELFRDGDKFLAVSQVVRQRLISLGCPAEKIDILRSGIDLSRFRFRRQTAFHSPVRMLSVGRLSPNKGIEYGLRAHRLLLDSGYDIQYRLVGGGPARDALCELIKKLQLESHVVLEGAVGSDRVIDVLENSDILIAPSITGRYGEQEGLPNCLKEAMAVGVPVISTNTGGIPELIENGMNGYLVAEKSPSAIADCVKSVIENRHSLQALLEGARSEVERHFEINNLNDCLENTYLDLVPSL